jgi:hypothetical protein
LLSTNVALANGGGYAFGVKLTGSVAPFQASGTEHVQIQEEKLDITLRRTDASVVVRYTMRNLAAEPVRVQFGFPVEAIRDDDGLIDDAPEPREVRPKGLLGAIQQLKGYAVTAGGQQVTSKLEIEPFATGKIQPFPGSEALKNVAGWMVSTVTFPAASPLTLEIRYSADYLGSATFVSDDTQATPLSFTYRLSTGAVWNGPIAKGTVTVRVDGIPADEVEIAAPRDRFRREGDQWVWSFQALKPTLSDDISIRAVPGFFEAGIYDPAWRTKGAQSHLERTGKWGEGHQRFKARASSTLAPTKTHGFGAEHLAELRADAPWSEGVAGPGIGEWVEIEPTKPTPLFAISISPGFQSTNKPERFEQNGRPSRVEIALNGENRFTATLGDKPESQLIPILGYTKPVAKIRITILDVFPGTRFSDTCISRVVLYDRLTKAPEVHHAR